MQRHDRIPFAMAHPGAACCLLVGLATGVASAAESALPDGMAALKSLPIDHGTVLSLVHDDGPAPGGRPDAPAPRLSRTGPMTKA